MGKKYDLSSLSLLVIDNSNYMLSILKILLKGFGIQHLSDSNDAEEAFGLAKSMPIDIIIVDHTRTGTDGIAFIKQVRSAEASSNPYVPIIMLTAHSERTIVEQARDAGVTELLRKPITAAGLFSRILETVERPRPFIRSKTYFGPDRRRRVDENYTGEERRKDNLDAALKIDDEAEPAPAAS
ncbi:MAG: response regulator [Hyphomicrobiales bacterium]